MDRAPPPQLHCRPRDRGCVRWLLGTKPGRVSREQQLGRKRPPKGGASWNQVVAQTEEPTCRSAGWHPGHLVKGMYKVEGERWCWEKPSGQQEVAQACSVRCCRFLTGRRAPGKIQLTWVASPASRHEAILHWQAGQRLASKPLIFNLV